jgi:hypothetical protein
MEYKFIWKGEASKVEEHIPYGATCLYGGAILDLEALMRNDVELYATEDRHNYAIDRGNVRIAEFEV